MDKSPVILIFGAGRRRIGQHVACEAARRGYRICLHYFSSAEEAEEGVAECKRQGASEVFAVSGDIRKTSDVQHVVDTVVSRFGQIDTSLITSSIWNRIPLEKTSPDDLEEHLAINTTGTFNCCRNVGAVMIKQQGGGCIITMGDWAVTRPYLDYPAYFASKGAIDTITRTFAVELAHRNPDVRVNAVHPGPVMIPETLSAEERQQVINGTLVKRLGSPDHITKTVFFLAENDYVTGTSIFVDGGRRLCGNA